MLQMALDGRSDERRVARLALRLSVSANDEDEWRTVNGTHIKVGEGGEPKSGPPALKKALNEKREEAIEKTVSSQESSKKSTESLKKVAKSCTIKASDGVQIIGYSSHALDRLSERGVSESQAEDAITKPLRIMPDKTDEEGRPSRTYIGRDATVCVNPENGIITTGWKTGSRYRKKYGGEGNGQ